MTTTDLDLQEQTRRDDTYNKIDNIVKDVASLDVFPSLVWVWVWDMVKSKLEYYGQRGDYYNTNPDLTEKDIFDMLWQDAAEQGFTLQYGVEDLDDHIQDWMTGRNILLAVDDE